MATFDKNALLTLGVINDVSEVSDDAFALISSIALERLQILLCDDSLALDNLPSALIPLIADLFTWQWKRNPGDSEVQSETTENYSYSLKSTTTANYLIRLREAYPEVIAKYSKCENAGGTYENAEHLPEWTPDYYKERNPWL